MRITEQYSLPASTTTATTTTTDSNHNHDHNSSGHNSNPYSKARWTSDDLILNHDEIQGVDGDQVKILPFGDIMPLLDHIPLEDNTVTEENYIAFEYGNLGGGGGGGKDTDIHMNSLVLVNFNHLQFTCGARIAEMLIMLPWMCRLSASTRIK